MEAKVTGFRLRTFGGKAPKIFARLLPEDMAQTATNVRLDSGRLEPWKDNATATITPVGSYAITGSTKTLFKFNSSIWIGSNSALDIVRSPLAEDPHERIYVSGIGGSTGYPRMTTSAIVGNNTYYRLGVPKPPDISTVATDTTTEKQDEEIPQSRAYVFTYVTAYGEEGQPCDALSDQIVDVYSDQNVVLTFPTNVSGNYNLTKKRIYRTDTTGTFRFVADVTFATTSYTDSLSEQQLGEAITSANFDAPPDDVSADHPDGPLLGLTALPNGVFAGFSGRTVSFSEAYLPHAFPDEYKLGVKSDIVALAPLQMGLLILTKEKPFLASGVDPATMALTEIDSTLSCVSSRSVVDMGSSVMYASPDGLVMATDNGLKLVTEDILTRDQWQELAPSSIIAFMWEGHYIGFYKDGATEKGFIFDPRGGKNSLTDLDFYATAGFNDLEEDELYIVVNGSVKKFAAGTNLSYTWKSRKFYNSRPINLGVAKVEADSYGSGITFKLYADGALKHTETVTSEALFRLPSGYKAKEFEVELSGSDPINEVCVYESAGEING
jgi:hypothetical protein